jgi:hypothetical protein
MHACNHAYITCAVRSADRSLDHSADRSSDRSSDCSSDRSSDRSVPTFFTHTRSLQLFLLRVLNFTTGTKVSNINDEQSNTTSIEANYTATGDTTHVSSNGTANSTTLQRDGK